MPGVAVLGLQWGDEGKGKVVDLLSNRAHMVVRFQGGANAGHTLVVNEERMLHNLQLGKGLVFSGQLLLELTARGMRRENAYRVVQTHAMEAWERGEDFHVRVREDPEIRKTLKEEEIDEVFRLERYLDHVDTIFARVFGAAADSDAKGR